MSLITDDPDDSPRDCSSRKHHHHGSSAGSRGRRRALIAASSAVASLLSLAFILWLTLRPASPRFSLIAATATATDLSLPNATVVIDAAFTARNPNAHAAALYDRLQLASASYAGVPLTAAAPLPPFDQLPQGDVVVSASLSSPVARAAGVVAGTTGGRALLRLGIEGQLRWKVAAWVSGRHALSVDCVAAVLLQPSPSSPRAVLGVVQGSPCAATVQ